METKAMLGPSGAFPVPFPAEVRGERARTPRPGHALGMRSRGAVCLGHPPACSLPWGTGLGCCGGCRALPFPWGWQEPQRMGPDSCHW